MLDTINGLFESIGFLFILPSIISLCRHKKVRGVSWVHAGFFWVWGGWNLVYYYGLGHWASWAGGMALFAANSVWFGLMVYYSWKGRNHAERQGRQKPGD